MTEENQWLDMNVDEKGDYIFRFRLDEIPPDAPVYEDKLTEFVRAQLEALLEVVILTEKGCPKKIDGFSFMNDPDKIYYIWRPPQEMEYTDKTDKDER